MSTADAVNPLHTSISLETYLQHPELLSCEVTQCHEKIQFNLSKAESLSTSNFDQADATALTAAFVLAVQNDLISSPLANNPQAIEVQIAESKKRLMNDLSVNFQHKGDANSAISMRLTYTTLRNQTPVYCLSGLN